MKKLLMFFCAGALISILFVGCSEFKQDQQQPKELGLGEEIPGMETCQATGTVIGYFIDQGYGSLFLQVDEKFPIGETIEYFKPEREFYYHFLLETGTYNNVIQVQHTLPIKTGNKMSFSVREYNDEKDFDLFFYNGGIMTMEHIRPPFPMYVIIKYAITEPKTNSL